jgi:serine phosphatase RsbU (regulator of sigma subunit)
VQTKMLNRFILFLLFSASAQFLHAQNIDSLLKILPQTKDTNRTKTLIEISGYYNNKDNSKALEYSLRALESAKKANKPKFIARANVLVGNHYTSMGDYANAIEYLINGFDIYEKSKNNRGASRAANAIGNMYLGQGNYRKAKEYYSLVIHFAKIINDTYGESLGNMGLSNVCSKTNDLKGALTYIEKSSAGFKEADRNFEYLASIVNKASILSEMQKYTEAYKTFSSCLPEVEKMGDKYFLSTIYLGLGNTLASLNKSNESLAYLRKALVVNRELKAMDDLKSIYQSMARAFKMQGNTDSAYYYLNKHVFLNDSLFKIENQQQINELEAKYQTQKKDAEIKQQQAKLVTRDAEIKVRDAEDRKNALFRNALIIGLLLTVVFLVFVFRSNIQKKKAYQQVSQQKNIIEQKNTEILDSIEYAKRIQRTLLASDSFLDKHLNEHFILYKPKDIVSGDFYWAAEIVDESGNKNFMLCTADCTGHGVPGAFMSLLCISFLNEITRESRIIKPNEVFTKLKREIVVSLNPDEAIQTQDGMDAVLCKFDFKNMKMQMACANNPIIILRKAELIEILPDKNPIGKNERTGYDYTLHSFELQKGDQIYTFTDGYSDQFGGNSGKKFKYKQFKQMIFDNRYLSMTEQKNKLESAIESWIGKLEQLDDILVIGIRV